MQVLGVCAYVLVVKGEYRCELVRKVTRRRRAKASQGRSIEAAARLLWRDLEDERRQGLVQALNIQDGALVVAVTQDPIILPSEWHGYSVRQEKYRKPESELVQRGKGALLGFLSIAEQDPERVFKLAEGAVETTRNAAAFLQEHPEEVRKFIANNLVAGVAKIAKKKLEK